MQAGRGAGFRCATHQWPECVSDWTLRYYRHSPEDRARPLLSYFANQGFEGESIIGKTPANQMRQFIDVLLFESCEKVGYWPLRFINLSIVSKSLELASMTARKS